MLIDRIHSPADLKALSLEDCDELAREIRDFLVEAVSKTGGHLGSNLGAVELTIALHRVFDSPRDLLIFDTGHQAYVHKILTGRKEAFAELRQKGGLSGYPSRKESPHDLVENSHASTALSYAHGMAAAIALRAGRNAGGSGVLGAAPAAERHVVAVVGDGALTGGMAYEALNNLGHSSTKVLVVLNDNGRSYAPTISKLSGSLTQLRLDPRYVQFRERMRHRLRGLPGPAGSVAYRSIRGLTSAIREVVEPHVFFEALGVRYTGPIDGHDVAALEQALRRAASWEGPIVLHVLTRKGKGYAPAEEDEIACLHDLKAPRVATPATPADEPSSIPPPYKRGESFTDAFTKAILQAAEADERVVAVTAAMPGPTGLLSFEEHFPERFFDVGIAEQHAMTAAAGMALQGLKPVVAIYSTFLARCVDQWNLDVGLHRAPVVVVADRAGITGDNGPSHHGIYDIVQALQVPGCAVFCPSEPAEVAPCLKAALALDAPALVRYPTTPSPGPLFAPGEGLKARLLEEGDGEVVLVGIGKLARACVEAARLLRRDGIFATVVDPRVVRPADDELIELLSAARLVVTAEDGLAHGGAGSYLVSLAERRAGRRPASLVLGVPSTYLAQGRPDDILSELGLDGPGIAASATKAARRSGIGSGAARHHLAAGGGGGSRRSALARRRQ